MVDSVLPGIDSLIDAGIVDEDRIGVMGHSQGGFSTLALISRTDRFKAAVMGAAYGDYASMFSEMFSDGSSYGLATSEARLGGALWDKPDAYVQNSPLFSLDKVKTPLLIYHGSSDRAVHPFLADQVFVGLPRLHRDVEYVKYEGEDHSPLSWTTEHKADLYRRILAWFERYLK